MKTMNLGIIGLIILTIAAGMFLFSYISARKGMMKFAFLEKIIYLEACIRKNDLTVGNYLLITGLFNEINSMKFKDEKRIQRNNKLFKRRFKKFL